ncbi:uncharacterized protein PGTG_11856 [Puccinia graminis f. sp. tritici CRL 75-36-700-3]|uniref:Uncharacterized protein n=1 Tax=Puccinia graminis f. sp. tritici (strain CRL 75-36-700-3 / race SCCL) TaxID=418459 RepID=E3KMH5_PUCGT|nr:uncharacterized protein PGTG_11856 [Puccinia graminis f. sp. tritici CRL 75-36-700-3]EFP85500.1 hypothetical protein PGTG_11856 [Puccinia graminis f. sp. tritici CRL 75-36-700-3]
MATEYFLVFCEVKLGYTMEKNAKWTMEGITVQSWIRNTKPREKELSTKMISKEEYTINQQGIVLVSMCVWIGIDCDGLCFLMDDSFTAVDAFFSKYFTVLSAMEDASGALEEVQIQHINPLHQSE